MAVGPGRPDRCTQVMAADEKLNGRLADVRGAPLAAGITVADVRNSLSADLTAQVATTVRPAMNKAIDLETPLLEQLGQPSAAVGDVTG